MKIKKRTGRTGPKKKKSGSGRTTTNGKRCRAKAKATGTPMMMTGMTGQAMTGTRMMDGTVMMGQQWF